MGVSMLVNPLSLRAKLGSLLSIVNSHGLAAAADNLLAFPGAQGAAAQTPGGRAEKSSASPRSMPPGRARC